MNAHPAAELFPMLSDEGLRDLAADIKANGLLEPITTYDGMILDGRNRYEACRISGVDPKFEEWGGPGSPILYVAGKNLRRRHLTSSQRAAIGAELTDLLREDARKRQGRRTDLKTTSAPVGEEVSGTSYEIAARAAGSSKTHVHRASVVRREDPEAFRRVKEGKETVTSAHRRVTDAANGHSAPPTRAARAERIDQIRGLAERGYSSGQIASEIGIGSQRVRNIAKEEGITISADVVQGKSWAVDPNRVVRETAIAAEGVVSGLDMLDGQLDRLDRAEIGRWVSSLTESVRELNALIRALKGVA